MYRQLHSGKVICQLVWVTHDNLFRFHVRFFCISKDLFLQVTEEFYLDKARYSIIVYLKQRALFSQRPITLPHHGRGSRIVDVSPGNFFRNFSWEVHSFFGKDGEGSSSFSSFPLSSDFTLGLGGFSCFSGVSKDIARAWRRKGFPSLETILTFTFWLNQCCCWYITSGRPKKCIDFMLGPWKKVNALPPGQCIENLAFGSQGFIFFGYPISK